MYTCRSAKACLDMRHFLYIMYVLIHALIKQYISLYL